MEKCQDCGQKMVGSTTCSIMLIKVNGVIHRRDTSYYDINETCHDCGIMNKPGNIHHFGCDIERCPNCGGQLISCRCREKALVLEGK